LKMAKAVFWSAQNAAPVATGVIWQIFLTKARSFG
jgi:hypothetical protein